MQPSGDEDQIQRAKAASEEGDEVAEEEERRVGENAGEEGRERTDGRRKSATGYKEGTDER
jgi:hypothetical protein